MVIHGTKLLDTDIELLAAALTQKEVLVWSMDIHDVYIQIDSGIIASYTADQVSIKSLSDKKRTKTYLRESCEFSVKFDDC
jgi:hypothetical protein